MKSKIVFVLCGVALFVTGFASAQEIHTQANAASINNEANATTGWAGSANESAVSTESYSGTYSIKIEAGSNGWFYSGYTFTSTQDAQYVVQIFAKSDSPEDPGIYWSGVVENASTSITSNTWTLYSKTVTATGSSVSINVYPGTPAVSGNTAYIDHISIVPVGISDTEAPTVPILSSSTNTDTTVDLNWTAATDDTAVTNYKIFKDGTLEATLGNELIYQATGLIASTAYAFTVTALDAALNESAASNTLNITTHTADTQAPTAATLSSNVYTDTTVDLEWSGATDNTAVTEYKVFKDGVLETTLFNAETIYQVTGLTASTAYAFTVTALDAANNESVASNTVNLTTNATSGGGNWNLNGNNITYTAGNVGIGTAAQSSYKLAVDGKIHTKEVKVDLTGWADYVFMDDYSLPSLEEVAEHIKAKGHLINIPSAEEVETNGIALGEMNKLLLEKIEELTLYTIEQQKTIEHLINEVNILKSNK